MDTTLSPVQHVSAHTKQKLIKTHQTHQTHQTHKKHLLKVKRETTSQGYETGE